MPDIDYAKLARARPADLVHAIETHDVTTSFGSPIVFRNLARYCSERRITLSSMKRMFCAGAPVGPETLRQLASVLPQTSRIWTPYGATEAMPLCAIDADEVLQETAAATRRGAGTCVGRPLDGTRVKVIRLTDRAVTRWDSALELGPGEVGELVAQGTQVTSRYFRNPRADRLAKIVETTPDGAEVVWHRTGDVGRFDDRGRVWLHGRTKHVVRHRGETYYPVCVEGIFNAEPGVRRTALIGYRGKRGAELVLVVEPDPATRPRTARSWRDALLAVGRRHGIPLTRVVFRRRPLPTDRRHNSKIERLALSRWARKRYG
jgi:acyl-CoA synthetase (AMP-forming)/AMP-acid ligase II